MERDKGMSGITAELLALRGVLFTGQKEAVAPPKEAAFALQGRDSV